MLKVNHIQKNYSHFNLNCSFDVPKGTITGIIGKNGSGKTTLFKSILNLIHLDSGSISILDTDYQNVDKNKIGCTLANISLCEYLKLKDLIKLLENTYQDFDLDYFIQKCKYYQFPLDKKINEFSTGMKAKLNVLIALAHHSQFLILDEPITGLDPMAIQDFYSMIRKLNREDKVAIIMVSHDLRNAVEEANKILHLQKQVLFYGLAHDYMNSKAAGHFFHEKEQGECLPTAACHMAKNGDGLENNEQKCSCGHTHAHSHQKIEGGNTHERA